MLETAVVLIGMMMLLLRMMVAIPLGCISLPLLCLMQLMVMLTVPFSVVLLL
jgi:hypothetical protein